MLRIVGVTCLVLLIGCGAQEQAGDAPADTPAMAAAPVSLADFAGTWDVQAMPADRDTVLVTYELVATDVAEGWTVTFPDMEPLALRILTVDGDSVVTEMGPYPSLLRDGATVTSVRSVLRLQGGMLGGTFTARYETDAADSVLQGRMHGMPRGD